MGPERDHFGKYIVALAVLLLLGMCAAEALAQTTTGKVAGRVTDARTKEALPGASVTVVGTRLGAITDANGEYAILGLTPGSYRMKVSVVGYAAQEVPAQVTVDRTTTLDVALAVEAIQMGAVEVVGQRPVVERGISFTQQILTHEVMQAIPAPTSRIQDVIRTQVGVDFDNWGITIRGNSDQDVAFLQDGLRFNPRMFQRPFSSYAKSSTQEVQVLTGGFAPEYGQARAGVVNLVSKEPRKWLISADVRVSSPSLKHFGPNAYKEDYWQVTRYLSSAPTADQDQDGKPDFEGWDGWLARTKALNQNKFAGQTVSTAQQAKTIWLYQHRRVKKDGTVLFADGSNPGIKDPQGLLNVDGEELDYERTYDITVGGPLVKNRVGFLYTYRDERQPFAVFANPPYFTSKFHQGRLTFTPTMNTRLTLMGLRSRNSGSGIERNSGTTDNSAIKASTGNSLRAFGVRANGAWEAKALENEFLYKDWQVGASWRHALSARTFYETSFTTQRIRRSGVNSRIVDDRNVVAVYPDGKVEIYPGIARDTPLVSRSSGSVYYPETPEQKAWADAARARGAVVMHNGPNGWVYPGNTGRDILGLSSIGGNKDGRRNDSTWSRQSDLSATLTTQLLRRHEVKTGLSLQVSDAFQSDGTQVGHEYQFVAFRKHWSGALFAQDKMEYRSLIVNAGARLEFDRYAKHEDFHAWDPNDPASDWFWKDPRRGAFDPTNFEMEKAKAVRRPPTQWYFAPRLALSYPITVSSKVYFNYGYFYRAPNMLEMYSIYQGEAGGTQPVYTGNPYMPALKQLQYEMGYEQGFFTSRPYAFKLSGNVYFKDAERDRYQRYLGFRAPPGRFAGWQPDNPYEQKDIRGLELSVQKQTGRWWIGSIGYDFNIAKTDRVWYNSVGFDQTEDPKALGLIYALGQVNGSRVEAVIDMRPIVRAHLAVYSPREWSKDLLKGGWELSMQYQWKRGQGFNYNPTNDPLLIGKLNQRWTAEKWLNLNLTKDFDVKGLRPQVYLDVSNLFDWAFPNLIGQSNMFTSDTDGYLGQGSSQVARYQKYMNEIIRRGQTPGEFIGEEGSADFRNFMPPRWWVGYTNRRDVYFGMRFEM